MYLRREDFEEGVKEKKESKKRDYKEDVFFQTKEATCQ
jgi:hypothetical protein